MARLVPKHFFLLYLNALMISLINALAASSEGCVIPGCTNYWNFEKNFIDQKNPSIVLFNSHNFSWVSNRHGEEESALYLNNGYFQINSSSVSWTGDFSIAMWVYVKTRVACGKLFDCGIKGQNELVINLNSCNGDGLSLQLYTNRSVSEFVYNRNRLEAKWQHVAFTFNSGKIVIYTDGVPVASGKTNVKPNVNSNYGTCSIGKSLWNNPNINAYIDDLWMFNRALSDDEVQIVMNNSVSIWKTTTSSQKMTSTSTKCTSTQANTTKNTTTSIKTTSIQTTRYTTNNNTTITTTITSSTAFKDYTAKNSTGFSVFASSNKMSSFSQITYFSSGSKLTSVMLTKSTPSPPTSSAYSSNKANSTTNSPQTTRLISIINVKTTITTTTTTFTFSLTETITQTTTSESISLIETSTTSTTTTTSLITTTMSENDKLYVALSYMRLINHWDFDNNYLDLKSGAPLLITNAIFTKDRFKKEKSAVEFAFGQMRIPGFYFRGSFSVLAWVYISNVDATEQRLLYCQEPSVSLKFTLQTGNDKYSYFSINDQNLKASQKLPTKTWIQVGVTLDDNRRVNIWYNGTSVSSAVFESFPQNLTWTDCFVGYNSNNADNFNLYLDDLMFFSNGLSSDDINLVKDNPVVRPSGPISNWQFNADYVDSVTKNTFANGNSDWFAPDRNGKTGSAFHIDNDFFQVDDCPNINLTHSTVMFWFYQDDNGAQNQNILAFVDLQSMFAIRDSFIQVFIDNQLINSFDAQITTWIHLATTQNANGYNIVFVNGELMAQTDFVSSFKSGQECQFGKNVLHLSARIDDVMFFNRTLSASEILLYKNS